MLGPIIRLSTRQRWLSGAGRDPRRADGVAELEFVTPLGIVQQVYYNPPLYSVFPRGNLGLTTQTRPGWWFLPAVAGLVVLVVVILAVVLASLL